MLGTKRLVELCHRMMSLDVITKLILFIEIYSIIVIIAITITYVRFVLIFNLFI